MVDRPVAITPNSSVTETELATTATGGGELLIAQTPNLSLSQKTTNLLNTLQANLESYQRLHSDINKQLDFWQAKNFAPWNLADTVLSNALQAGKVRDAYAAAINETKDLREEILKITEQRSLTDIELRIFSMREQQIESKFQTEFSIGRENWEGWSMAGAQSLQDTVETALPFVQSAMSTYQQLDTSAVVAQGRQIINANSTLKGAVQLLGPPNKPEVDTLVSVAVMLAFEGVSSNVQGFIKQAYENPVKFIGSILSEIVHEVSPLGKVDDVFYTTQLGVAALQIGFALGQLVNATSASSAEWAASLLVGATHGIANALGSLIVDKLVTRPFRLKELVDSGTVKSNTNSANQTNTHNYNGNPNNQGSNSSSTKSLTNGIGTDAASILAEQQDPTIEYNGKNVKLSAYEDMVKVQTELTNSYDAVAANHNAVRIPLGNSSQTIYPVQVEIGETADQALNRRLAEVTRDLVVPYNQSHKDGQVAIAFVRNVPGAGRVVTVMDSISASDAAGLVGKYGVTQQTISDAGISGRVDAEVKRQERQNQLNSAYSQLEQNFKGDGSYRIPLTGSDQAAYATQVETGQTIDEALQLNKEKLLREEVLPYNRQQTNGKVAVVFNRELPDGGKVAYVVKDISPQQVLGLHKYGLTQDDVTNAGIGGRIDKALEVDAQQTTASLEKAKNSYPVDYNGFKLRVVDTVVEKGQTRQGALEQTLRLAKQEALQQNKTNANSGTVAVAFISKSNEPNVPVVVIAEVPPNRVDELTPLTFDGKPVNISDAGIDGRVAQGERIQKANAEFRDKGYMNYSDQFVSGLTKAQVADIANIYQKHGATNDVKGWLADTVNRGHIRYDAAANRYVPNGDAQAVAKLRYNSLAEAYSKLGIKDDSSGLFIPPMSRQDMVDVLNTAQNEGKLRPELERILAKPPIRKNENGVWVVDADTSEKQEQVNIAPAPTPVLVQVPGGSTETSQNNQQQNTPLGTPLGTSNQAKVDPTQVDLEQFKTKLPPQVASQLTNQQIQELYTIAAPKPHFTGRSNPVLAQQTIEQGIQFARQNPSTQTFYVNVQVPANLAALNKNFGAETVNGQLKNIAQLDAQFETDISNLGGQVSIIQGRGAEVHLVVTGVSGAQLETALANWKQRVDRYNSASMTNTNGELVDLMKLDHPKGNDGNSFGIPMLYSRPLPLGSAGQTAASLIQTGDYQIQQQQPSSGEVVTTPGQFSQSGQNQLNAIAAENQQLRASVNPSVRIARPPFSSDYAQFVGQAKINGVDHDTAAKLYHETNRSFDTNTGIYTSSAISSGIEYAIEAVKTKPGAQSIIIEMDVGNIGGLNQAVGRDTTDKLLVTPVKILESELLRQGVETSAIRAGGDEFVVIASGGVDLQQKVDSAIQRTKQRVQELNSFPIEGSQNYGTLGEVPNPKYKGQTDKNGIGVYFGTAQVTPVSTVATIRQQTGIAVENAKISNVNSKQQAVGTQGSTPNDVKANATEVIDFAQKSKLTPLEAQVILDNGGVYFGGNPPSIKRVGAENTNGTGTGDITLGRNPSSENHFQIGGNQSTYRTVSANHARINQNSSGAYVITDSGSSNGTWINGKNIKGQGAQPLRNYDSVLLGAPSVPDGSFSFIYSDPNAQNSALTNPFITGQLRGKSADDLIKLKDSTKRTMETANPRDLPTLDAQVKKIDQALLVVHRAELESRGLLEATISSYNSPTRSATISFASAGQALMERARLAPSTLTNVPVTLVRNGSVVTQSATISVDTRNVAIVIESNGDKFTINEALFPEFAQRNPALMAELSAQLSTGRVPVSASTQLVVNSGSTPTPQGINLKPNDLVNDGRGSTAAVKEFRQGKFILDNGKTLTADGLIAANPHLVPIGSTVRVRSSSGDLLENAVITAYNPKLGEFTVRSVGAAGSAVDRKMPLRELLVNNEAAFGKDKFILEHPEFLPSNLPIHYEGRSGTLLRATKQGADITFDDGTTKTVELESLLTSSRESIFGSRELQVLGTKSEPFVFESAQAYDLVEAADGSISVVFREGHVPQATPATITQVRIRDRVIEVVSPSNLSQEDVLNTMSESLASLPDEVLKSIDRVELDAGRNPLDAYWERKYNSPDFRSHATAGKTQDGKSSIRIFNGFESLDKSHTFNHEFSHLIAGTRFGSSVPGQSYIDAAKLDDSRNGQQPVTNYSATAIAGAPQDGYAEDYAEFGALYLQAQKLSREGNNQPLEYLKNTFPNRYQHFADDLSNFTKFDNAQLPQIGGPKLIPRYSGAPVIVQATQNNPGLLANVLAGFPDGVEISFGRGDSASGNSLILNDATSSISRSQGVFTKLNGELYITPNRGSAPISVNGQPISGRTVLHRGDVLQIGQYNFNFGVAPSAQNTNQQQTQASTSSTEVNTEEVVRKFSDLTAVKNNEELFRVLGTPEFTFLASGQNGKIYTTTRDPNVVIRIEKYAATADGIRGQEIAANLGIGPKTFHRHSLDKGANVVLMERMPGVTYESLVRKGSLTQSQLDVINKTVIRDMARLANANSVWTDAHWSNVMVDVKPDGSVSTRLIDFEANRSLGEGHRYDVATLYQSIRSYYAKAFNLGRPQEVSEQQHYEHYKQLVLESFVGSPLRATVEEVFTILDAQPDRRADPHAR